MIPQSFIQELLGRVEIVDLIDRHVKLKRAGANYVACCPFHSEKTPSFTVSPTKQFYHCFGCGAHGTAVGFLMEYSAMGFVDAVKELAQGVGMQVPENRSEPDRRKPDSDLYDILLQAAQYYRGRLKDSPRAIAYLKQRGLSGEIAKRFGIGYAPDGWQNLAAAFSDYSGPLLAAAGLVKSNEEGRRYDVFRDRVIFPIVDVRGNVIGFGGRVLGDGEPKYLNSPETPVFEKGRELYGLYQARRAIREAGRVVVVEGYMDVVALAQHGIEYAVATLGTATTPLHVQKLLRQSDEIVFCFDGDDAGRRAAWRALEGSLAQLQDGKQVKFLFLPEGEDPDSYVRKNGRPGLETLFERAAPLSKFLLDTLEKRVDLATAEGRAGLLHEAKPLIRQMQATLLRVQLLRELGEKCRLSAEEVARLLDLAPTGAPSRAPEPRYPRVAPAPIARTLLRILVANPTLAVGLTPEQRELLDAAELAPVAELIGLVRESDISTPAMVIEATRDSAHTTLFQQVAGETMAGADDPETAQAEWRGAFTQLELVRVQGEYQRLTAAGTRSPAERDRFQQLSRRLAELKGAAGTAAPPPA
jgi:DNA primase